MRLRPDKCYPCILTSSGNQQPSGNQRHRIDYEYDGFGNLERQTVENVRNGNIITSIENYQYDDLHRLTNASRTIGGAAQTAVTYQYDKVGNFTLKSDYVNSYSYSYGNASKSLGGNAGSNAVRSITKVSGGTATYAYDLNGNMQSGDGKVITYNAFNKPVSITKNSTTSVFSYGADQLRFKQIKTKSGEETETTIYIDKAYEVITQGSVTKKRAYLGDAILTETIGGTNAGYKIGFVHRDRLNSVVTITDDIGDVMDSKSYDAFGKPREGTFELITPSALEAIANAGGYELQTNRGFTDHEHLDEAELIHMNGRVYDYNLGRFLSVDPFIQDPGNSQSMNPYSYILNNPLSGTDPSGYMRRTSRFDGSLCSHSASGCDGRWQGGLSGIPARKNGGETTTNIKLKEGNNVTKIEDITVDDIESIEVSDNLGGYTVGFTGGTSNIGTNGISSREREGVGKKSTLSREERRKRTVTAVDKVKGNIIGIAFDGIEEVATALHDALNPISIKYDLEIGATLYATEGNSGKVFAQNLRIENVNGKVGSVNVKYKYKSFSVLGTWHSHGNLPSSFTFSHKDFITGFTAFFRNHIDTGGFHGSETYKGDFVSTTAGQLQFFDPVHFTFNNLKGRSDFKSIPFDEYYRSSRIIK